MAPVPVPLFVIEPAAQLMQSDAALEPVVPVYLPAPQSVHAFTFEAVEYFPAAHVVHETAPVLSPAFVIEPASQVMPALHTWRTPCLVSFGYM